MVPQSSIYLGQLRCRTAHDPSNVELVTDAPRDNHGRGESFSPTDLVVTALTTCMVTTAGIAAQRDGVKLDGTRMYAEKHMSTGPPRRISKIVVRIEFAPNIPQEYRPKLEHIVRSCPVALSIHPDIALDLALKYPD